VTTLAELKTLIDISPNQHDRVPLEKSAIYAGYKLVWAARIFIQGRKFPHGDYVNQEWSRVAHSVVGTVLQPEFMQTLLAIDSEAFFQMIFLAFNKSQKQFYHF
jgi:hypothetical protein